MPSKVGIWNKKLEKCEIESSIEKKVVKWKTPNQSGCHQPTKQNYCQHQSIRPQATSTLSVMSVIHQAHQAEHIFISTIRKT